MRCDMLACHAVSWASLMRCSLRAAPLVPERLQKPRQGRPGLSGRTWSWCTLGWGGAGAPCPPSPVSSAERGRWPAPGLCLPARLPFPVPVCQARAQGGLYASALVLALSFPPASPGAWPRLLCLPPLTGPTLFLCPQRGHLLPPAWVHREPWPSDSALAASVALRGRPCPPPLPTRHPRCQLVRSAVALGSVLTPVLCQGRRDQGRAWVRCLSPAPTKPPQGDVWGWGPCCLGDMCSGSARASGSGVSGPSVPQGT